RRWSVETPIDFRDIADAKGAARNPNGEVANLFHCLEAAADAKLYPITEGFDETGGHYRVLCFERLLDRLQRHTERRQFDVGKLDPDFLVLQAEQFDLADARDPLQL